MESFISLFNLLVYTIHHLLFTLKVMVIKISEIAHFLYFMLMAAKQSVAVWTKYLSASEGA